MKHRQNQKPKSRLYIVEKIVGRRYDPISKELQYCIKWQGYSETQNTWEPVRNLKNLQSDIQEFENQQHNKKLNMNLKIDNKKLKQQLLNKLTHFLEKIAPKPQQLQQISLSDYESSCDENLKQIKQPEPQSITIPDHFKEKSSILIQSYP